MTFFLVFLCSAFALSVPFLNSTASKNTANCIRNTYLETHSNQEEPSLILPKAWISQWHIRHQAKAPPVLSIKSHHMSWHIWTQKMAVHCTTSKGFVFCWQECAGLRSLVIILFAVCGIPWSNLTTSSCLSRQSLQCIASGMRCTSFLQCQSQLSPLPSMRK